jgi:hypothetical protein
MSENGHEAFLAPTKNAARAGHSRLYGKKGNPRKAKPRQYIRGEASTHARDRCDRGAGKECPELVYEM